MSASAMRIETGSRLHFGLLGWGPELPRQFGGVGLMIDNPGLVIEAREFETWRAQGPLSERCLKVAQAVALQLEARGTSVSPLAFDLIRAPREHTGLGVGTQASLAIARLVIEHARISSVTATELARLTGRGLRSGIGLHGFDRGGLIVDGGRGSDDRVPPLLSALPFPADWNILLVSPELERGRHGQEERAAFQTMPGVPLAIHEKLCRLLVTGILPAVAEEDLDTFGAALEEFQEVVGGCFATAQGGTFSQPLLGEIAQIMKQAGLVGVGQSSWGPTLYAFTDREPEELASFTAELAHRYNLGPQGLIWTKGRQGPPRITLKHDVWT